MDENEHYLIKKGVPDGFEITYINKHRDVSPDYYEVRRIADQKIWDCVGQGFAYSFAWMKYDHPNT